MFETGGFAMPLSLVGAGEDVRVSAVRGSEEVRRHLGSLGFVGGADVHVVSRSASNVIVMVKGARLGLDAKTANRIMVG